VSVTDRVPTRFRPFVAELGPLTAYTLALTAVGAVRPSASYKALDLGANAFEVGVVGGAYGLLAMFAAIPVGLTIDRSGERRWVVGGLTLVSVAAVFELLAPTIIVVAVGQALLGLGQVCVAVAIQARTASLAGPPGRDERFARLAVMTSVTQLLGPLVAGSIIGNTAPGPARAEGIAAALAVSGTMAALGVMVALVGIRSVAHRHGLPSRRGRAKAGELLRQEGMMASLVSGVTVSTTADLLVAYLPVLGEEHAMSPAFVGVVLAVRGGASLTSRVALGPMLARWGRRRLLASMLLISAVSLVGIAASGWAVAYLALAVSLGFGLGVSGPITQAWTAESAAADARGSALAIRISVNRLSQLLVPAIFGGFALTFGSGVVFLFAASALTYGSALVGRAKLA
jgi:MFS family permease